MDSYIFFNADIGPPTDDKSLDLEQEISINEELLAQNLGTTKITNVTSTQDKLHETENLSLPTLKMTKTPNIDHKQEILWYLEFDGSINKLE